MLQYCTGAMSFRTNLKETSLRYDLYETQNQTALYDYYSLNFWTHDYFHILKTFMN